MRKINLTVLTVLVVTLASGAAAWAASFNENFEGFTDGQSIPANSAWVNTFGPDITATGTGGFQSSVGGVGPTNNSQAFSAHAIANETGGYLVTALVNVSGANAYARFGVMENTGSPFDNRAGVEFHGAGTNEAFLFGEDATDNLLFGSATPGSYSSLGWFKAQILLNADTDSASGRYIDINDTTGAEIGSWTSLGTAPFAGTLSFDVAGIDLALGTINGSGTSGIVDNISGIPEPATLGLLALGGLMMLRTRH